VLYASYGVQWVPVEHFKDDLPLARINPGPTGNYIAA